MGGADNLMKTSNFRQKISSCFEEKPFIAKRFNTLIMGPLITTSLMEIVAYCLLLQDVKASHLPSYILDVLIVSFSILEVLAAPILGWLGSQRRKKPMLCCIVAALVVSIPPFFLPKFQAEDNNNDFCPSNEIVVTEGVPTSTIIRLVVLLPMLVVAVVTRVTIWSHGLGYFCERPGTEDILSLHFGITLLGRGMGLAMGLLLINKVVEDLLWLQLLFFVLPSLMQIMQIAQLPVTFNDDVAVSRSGNGLGFFQSLGRVASNWLAMSQVFAMGFLAAGLWGYGYNHLDMFKTQYHLGKPDSIYNSMSIITCFIAAIVIIIFWGVLYSAPKMLKFNKTQALKTASLACFYIVAIYFATAFLTCDKGTVAGLSDESYNQPECSSTCRCAQKWDSLDPVCVIDQNQAITYLSPCHAGCDSYDDETRMFINCACSSQTNSATRGACNINNCFMTQNFHRILFIFIVLSSLIAFQAQVVVIIKSVDKRDVSIAFGVALSVFSLFAFVCGHLGYWTLRTRFCIWSEAGNCQLHSSNYPSIVSYTSASLSFIAFVFTLVVHIVLRRRKEDTLIQENTEL